MSDLAQGWVTTSLEELVTFSVGGLWGSPPDSAKPDSVTVSVIRGADYRNWDSERAARAVVRSVAAKAAESRRLKKGDIVVEVSGGGPTQPVGRVVIVDDAAIRSTDRPLILSNFCRRAVVSPQVDPSFVYYQLLYKYLSGDTLRFQTATTNIRNLNFGKYLVETEIALAPQPEQGRIVGAIEEEFSRLDAGVAALERARRNLSRMEGAVLQAAVLGRLVSQHPADGNAADEVAELPNRRRFTKGMAPPSLQGYELPRSWTTAYLEDLADRVTVGFVGPMQHEYVAEGVPFLRSQNVRPNRFDPDGLKFIGARFHERIIKSKLLPGDVVIVRSGDVGTACVIPETLVEANCSDLVVIQRPRGIDPRFVAYYMNSIGQRYVRAGRVGVALTHFNTKSVAALPVPVPPLREQERIVAEAERQLSIMRELGSIVCRAEARCPKSRASILSAAFSGSLVPQDPNDEPASGLLERVARERAESDGSSSAAKRARRKRAVA